MRVSRIVPEDEIRLVELKKYTLTRPGKYKLYSIQPVVLGELEYDGVDTWTTDDGLQFRFKSQAEEYFKKRAAKEGLPLRPGKYQVGGGEITRQGSRVIIKTEDDEIVILTELPGD